MAGSNFELAESTLASIPAREKISKEIGTRRSRVADGLQESGKSRIQQFPALH